MARILCAAKREARLSMRRKSRSDVAGKRIAGREKSSASKIVKRGSASQVGAEESIKS